MTHATPSDGNNQPSNPAHDPREASSPTRSSSLRPPARPAMSLSAQEGSAFAAEPTAAPIPPPPARACPSNLTHLPPATTDADPSSPISSATCCTAPLGPKAAMNEPRQHQTSNSSSPSSQTSRPICQLPSTEEQHQAAAISTHTTPVRVSWHRLRPGRPLLLRGRHRQHPRHHQCRLPHRRQHLQPHAIPRRLS